MQFPSLNRCPIPACNSNQVQVCIDANNHPLKTYCRCRECKTTAPFIWWQAHRPPADDPNLDFTDNPHPAFARGNDHAIKVICDKLERLIHGQDISNLYQPMPPRLDSVLKILIEFTVVVAPCVQCGKRPKGIIMKLSPQGETWYNYICNNHACPSQVRGQNLGLHAGTWRQAAMNWNTKQLEGRSNEAG
jgi:hypothetical protein